MSKSRSPHRSSYFNVKGTGEDVVVLPTFSYVERYDSSLRYIVVPVTCQPSLGVYVLI